MIRSGGEVDLRHRFAGEIKVIGIRFPGLIAEMRVMARGLPLASRQPPFKFSCREVVGSDKATGLGVSAATVFAAKPDFSRRTSSQSRPVRVAQGVEGQFIAARDF